MSRVRFLVCACCAAALLMVAAPSGAAPPPPGERIVPGVSAAGVDLSGLTVADAVQRLEALSPRLQSGSVTVKAADLTFRLKTADANVIFDTVTTAKRALFAGRQARGAAVDVPLAVSRSYAAVRRFAGRVDKRLTRSAVDSRAIITLRRVRVTHSKSGRSIDGKALLKAVDAAILDPRLPRVLTPKLQRVKARLDADQARKTVSTVITIKQSTFTLRLFKNLKVVKTYKVAVGQSGYSTPNGRFAIQSKQIDPVWSVPNSPWAGELAGSTVAGGSAANPLKARWMGVSGSVGIHGTSQGYSIGTRASRGCIRMYVPDVKALYKRVPLGTPVLIGR